jgi:hypothetical protein
VQLLELGNGLRVAGVQFGQDIPRGGELLERLGAQQHIHEPHGALAVHAVGAHTQVTLNHCRPLLELGKSLCGSARLGQEFAVLVGRRVVAFCGDLNSRVELVDLLLDGARL